MTPYTAPGCNAIDRYVGSDVLDRVARIAGTTPAKILSRDRHHPLPMARAVVANMMRTRASLHEIGKLIHKDHSTVQYYHKKHLAWMECWPEYAETWRKVKEGREWPVV